MSSHAEVEALIRRRRPQAKFIAVQHSGEFIDDAADLGAGFFTVNVYDEYIDANMFHSKLGWVMVQNTYISSFAYNLFLSWLYAHQFSNADHATSVLNQLLRINLKKFLAEQIYVRTNRVQSRGLFLETLLFEQAQMVEVFAAKHSTPRLAELADNGAGLMSLALSVHELGHYLIATKKGAWDDFFNSLSPGLQSLCQGVIESSPREVAAEYQCDLMALIGCINQYESRSRSGFVYRAIVFSFAAYAAMYSAAASAAATSELWEAHPDEPLDCRDISPMPYVNYKCILITDDAMMLRARLVAQTCDLLASERGLFLYGTDDPFPLPETIIDDMMRLVDGLFESNDGNARAMSNLVARALTGHDTGMEYLHNRSKVFQTNRAEPLSL